MRRWSGFLMALTAVLALAVPAHAAFPGQNGKLAYGSCGPQDCGIFVSDADGANSAQITHNPDFVVLHGNIRMPDAAPAWSADGRQIAYVRVHANGSWDIRVVSADGTGDHSLGVNGTHPSWSPDGSRIVFLSGATHQIAVMNADGTGATELTSGLQAGWPDWSPDGEKIAFARTLSSGSLPNEIYVMNADGSNQTRLTFDQVGSADPSWSPDGGRIAFQHGSDPAELYVVNADGSGLAQLTDWPTPQPPDWAQAGDDEAPAWSPDGSRIVFSRILGSGRLTMIEPDGSGAVEVGFGTTPAWQPLQPSPRREDYKNASHFCKAERDFLGEQDFTRKYGSHGGCVSGQQRN